jgi:hypothetical protein
MSQTKLGSFAESWANIGVGFAINFIANLYILPAFGFASLTPGKNFAIGLLYTVISLMRSYGMRRVFNAIKFGNVGASPLRTQNWAESTQSGSAPTFDGRALFPLAAAERNEYPMFDGLLAYFPSALRECARVSKIGNDQHNPGQPIHHARGKSADHKNKIIRHLLEAGTLDNDGTMHSAKVLWRAAALCQEECEARGAPLAPAAKLP